LDPQRRPPLGESSGYGRKSKTGVKVWDLDQGLFYLITKSKLVIGGTLPRGEKKHGDTDDLCIVKTVKFVLPFECQPFRPSVIILSVIISRRTANDLVPYCINPVQSLAFSGQESTICSTGNPTRSSGSTA